MGNEPPSDKKPEEKSDEETVEKLIAPKGFIAGLTPVYTDYLKDKGRHKGERPGRGHIIRDGVDKTRQEH